MPTSLSPFLLKSSRECRGGISFISYGAPQGVPCQDLVYVGKPLCEGFVSRENVFAPELFVLISLLFIFFFFFIKFRFEANASCFIVVKNFIYFQDIRFRILYPQQFVLYYMYYVTYFTTSNYYF